MAKIMTWILLGTLDLHNKTASREAAMVSDMPSSRLVYKALFPL
jgi:hypothetical protein